MLCESARLASVAWRTPDTSDEREMPTAMVREMLGKARAPVYPNAGIECSAAGGTILIEAPLVTIRWRMRVMDARSSARCSTAVTQVRAG